MEDFPNIRDILGGSPLWGTDSDSDDGQLQQRQEADAADAGGSADAEQVAAQVVLLAERISPGCESAFEPSMPTASASAGAAVANTPADHVAAAAAHTEAGVGLLQDTLNAIRGDIGLLKQMCVQFIEAHTAWQEITAARIARWVGGGCAGVRAGGRAAAAPDHWRATVAAGTSSRLLRSAESPALLQAGAAGNGEDAAGV